MLTASTWTPKVCNIIAFMAVMLGVGLVFHILFGHLGFRYNLLRTAYVPSLGCNWGNTQLLLGRQKNTWDLLLYMDPLDNGPKP